MTLYDQSAVDDIFGKYNNRDGLKIATFYGGLLDSYIITADGCKMTIIREVYLNEWSSAYSIRFYNTPPKKYIKILTLVDEGKYDEAQKLFYGGTK